MTYKIGETCVKFGACLYECPFGAISEGEDRYIIDPDKCTECGACVENIFCPGWAIFKAEESDTGRPRY